MSNLNAERHSVVRFTYNAVEGGTVVSPKNKPMQQESYFPTIKPQIQENVPNFIESSSISPLKSGAVGDPIRVNETENYHYKNYQENKKNEKVFKLEAGNLPDAQE